MFPFDFFKKFLERSKNKKIRKEFVDCAVVFIKDLKVCPRCHHKTLRITPKKKIKFCFNCGRDIK